MIRKNKSIVALITLLLVAVLASGCFLFPTKYTVDVTIEPKDAADFKGPKKVKEGDMAEYTLEIAEGYVYVDYVVDPEDVEVLVEDDAFNIAEVNEDIKLTLNFEKEDEEPPVDELEAAIEAAEEAIAELEDPITLAHISAVENARELVDAAEELGAEEIEGLEKLEAAEQALIDLLHAESLASDDLIKGLFDVDFDEAYEEDELDLPANIEIAGKEYPLIWTSKDEDYVKIEDGKAKFTTPVEDTEVTLEAVLAVGIGAQAEQKTFSVAVELEGKVSKLYALAAAYDTKADDFKKLLEDLGVEFVKASLNDYATAIADILEPEKTLEELEAIIAEVDEANADAALEDVKAFNKAVETYFTTNSGKEKAKAYEFIKADIVDKAEDGEPIGIVDWFHEEEDKVFKEIYFGELEGRSFVSKEDLQAFVNQANLAYLEKLTDKAEKDILNEDLLTKATNFHGKITVELEDEIEASFAGRFDKIEWVRSIFNAAGEEEASADFKTALEEKDEDDKLILKNIVDVLMDNYSKAFAKIAKEVDEKTPVIPVGYDIQGVIDGVNQDELDAAIEWVLAGKAEPKDDEKVLKDALDHLVLVTEKDIEIRQAALKAYEKAIADDKPATAEEIFNIVEYQNLLADVNGEDESRLNSIIQNDLEIDAYVNLSVAQQEEVVIVIIANGKAKKGYESVDEFAEAVDEIVPDYLAVLAGVNEAKEKMDFISAVKEIGRAGVEYGVYTEEQVEERVNNQEIGQFFEGLIDLGEDDPRPFATIQALFDLYNEE